MATITRRGKSWAVQIRRKGHPSRSRSFRTKLAAINWATEQEAALLADQAVDQRHIDPSATLRLLVERYVRTVTPNKRSNETERYRLQKLLRDPISGLGLSNLTSADVAAYRDRRAEEVGAGTIRRELSLLHHIFELARREWGIPIAHNPVADISKPRLNNARTRRLMSGEWTALCQAFARSRNPIMALLVEVAIETGLRRGELLDLTWSNVDWRNSTMHIPHTKTGRPRTVPITPKARHLLGKLPRTDAKVFPFSANSVKLAWVRATKRAGIVDLRFHDLRHEAVSRFFELGLSMPEVALISGHRDPRMLMRYTHLDSSRLAAKLALLQPDFSR